MDFSLCRHIAIAITFGVTGFHSNSFSNAQSPRIQFDMPAITTAVDTSAATGQREVTFDLVVSSLVLDSGDDSSGQRPPIDHLLVRCALRDRLPVVDFSPRTELQTDYAGPISITKKDEQTGSFGLSVDGAFQYVGTGHAGADESHKQSDSTQFQRQAPMQAVIASGTTDRGRGVYFKLRWTNQQVLEGEKCFRVSVAVPESWRGGLVDVEVIANALEDPMFGPSKMQAFASRHFVVAVHQQNDNQAAAIALRLAQLDRELAVHAQRQLRSSGNPVSQIWRRMTGGDQKRSPVPSWYRGITTNQTDPYTDKQIQSLPMPVRVAVLGYSDAARELMELGDAG